MGKEIRQKGQKLNLWLGSLSLAVFNVVTNYSGTNGFVVGDILCGQVYSFMENFRRLRCLIHTHTHTQEVLTAENKSVVTHTYIKPP